MKPMHYHCGKSMPSKKAGSDVPNAGGGGRVRGNYNSIRLGRVEAASSRFRAAADKCHHDAQVYAVVVGSFN